MYMRGCDVLLLPPWLSFLLHLHLHTRSNEKVECSLQSDQKMPEKKERVD